MPSDTPTQYFKRTIFLPFFYSIIMELNSRFGNLASQSIQGLKGRFALPEFISPSETLEAHVELPSSPDSLSVTLADSTCGVAMAIVQILCLSPWQIAGHAQLYFPTSPKS